MNRADKISRKKFFNYILYLVGLPVLFLWQKLVDSQALFNKDKRTITLPIDLPNGASIFDEALVHKGENTLNIFSTRCSHLGCRINKFDSKGFICQCHGSLFSFDGNVLEGPAYRPLTSLPYKIDKKSNSIIIEINGKT